MKELFSKREREEEPSKVSTYFWDPFNVPSSPKRLAVGQENLESENQDLAVDPEWQVSSPDARGKRTLESPAHDACFRSKRGNFADISSLSRGKRSSSSSPEQADALSKRLRLMEALASKRRLDDVAFGSDLRANKKVNAEDADNDDEDDEMALVCVPRSADQNGEDEELWFGNASLSRIPPSVFAAPSPNSQMVVWEDQQERFQKIFFKKRGEAHPPLLAAANIVPRVEVLDSSDDEGIEAGASLAPGMMRDETEFDGVVPMDLSE